jgi:6-phosphofructokinase 2
MRTVTVTMNPVLDKSANTAFVLPEKKTRCDNPQFAPGGGGINVSRAIKNLGGESVAVFLAGGQNGKKIESLLTKEKLNFVAVDAGENTRENLVVYDNRAGNLYRFVMPGPEIEKKYWEKMLKTIKDFSPKPDYLVASGSLPPGVPEDFYTRLAVYAKKNDIKMILDTSGPALSLAMEEGVYMAKPNLREVAGLLNKSNLTGMELEQVATDYLNNREYCSVLIISLGAKGAMLVRRNNTPEYIFPPSVPVKSTIGAGDSMVAGIISACTKGMWADQAVRYGVAAGTAATMTPGTELCRKEDTDKIFDWLNQKNGNE